ncbi:MAG: hypothetical protein RL417_1928, partial [Pseudomonadota bacterium]
MQEYVLVLDFGSQYTQLIARRTRELGVYSEVKPCTVKPSEIDSAGLKAVILSGGPASVTDAEAPAFDPKWLEIGKPILGVCYGMQLIAHLRGGTLAKGASREYGHSVLEIVDTTAMFSGFEAGEKTSVWMSHGDHVVELPPGFRVTAKSPGSPIAAMANPSENIYALQYHLEVVHTPRGKDMLENFLFSIAGCGRTWNPANFIETSIGKIRGTVAAGANVICGLSGGVDSTVAAVLVDRALGDRLHCIFVDNGLLRKGEAEEVMARLGKDGLGLNVQLVDASEEFLTALRGVTSPEEKRKIIGRVFIEVFDRAAAKIPNVTHLVQGTLYPDVIESVSVRGPSATIKTHHNV